MEIKSITKERLIIQAVLNKKQHYFLIDTGATVGLISDKVNGLLKGKKFPKPIVGAGGEFNAYICNTFAYLDTKPISQFLIANIDNVVDSIYRETNIKISGIISLPQMQFIGMIINLNNNTIVINE